MFSSLRKSGFNFSITFTSILSSAVAFNLDKTEILLFGKETSYLLERGSGLESHLRGCVSVNSMKGTSEPHPTTGET